MERIFDLTKTNLRKYGATQDKMKNYHHIAWEHPDYNERDNARGQLKKLFEEMEENVKKDEENKQHDDFRRTIGAPHLHQTRSRPPTQPFEQFYSSSLSSTPELAEVASASLIGRRASTVSDSKRRGDWQGNFPGGNYLRRLAVQYSTLV